MLYDSILDTIGNTPLVKLHKIPKEMNSQIYVKVESTNPGGSIKDRAALNMIKKAEEKGLINQDTTIIEITSGNTGIGLALVCAVGGYKLKIIMPKRSSIERRKILKAFGAEVILFKGKTMKPGIKIAEKLSSKISNSFLTKQFTNSANPDAHKTTTALEIWEDLHHNVDVLVSCVGTGGTITGTGEKLRELNPNIHIIAIEPASSPILSGGLPGKSDIQGMGAGFIPEILNTKIYDEIYSITKSEAYHYANRLAKEEGIFAGMSSGAALAAAMKYASKNDKNENIVVILPDTGERYLSTEMWE
jgi:cysteine synthase